MAKQAAELRARYKILLPDALQLAACLQNHAQAFLTNDNKLKRVKDLLIICLKDYA